MTRETIIDILQITIPSGLTIWSTLYAAKANIKSTKKKPTKKDQDIVEKVNLLGLIASFICLIAFSILMKFKFDWVTVLGLTLSGISTALQVMTLLLTKTINLLAKTVDLHGRLLDETNSIVGTMEKLSEKGSITNTELEKLKKSIAKSKNN